MINDRIMENWLESIKQNTGNHAYEHIWQAYQLIVGMKQPEKVYSYHWTFEILKFGGLRLKSKFYENHTIDIESIEAKNFCLEFFRRKFCNSGSTTMEDWYVMYRPSVN